MKEKFHRSREAIMDFVGLFGKDGRIVSALVIGCAKCLHYYHVSLQSEFFHDQKEKIRRVFTSPMSSPTALEAPYFAEHSDEDEDD